MDSSVWGSGSERLVAVAVAIIRYASGVVKSMIGTVLGRTLIHIKPGLISGRYGVDNGTASITAMITRLAQTGVTLWIGLTGSVVFAHPGHGSHVTAAPHTPVPIGGWLVLL